MENKTTMRAMVAMSGGVDSSVAVLLLQEAGYEVAGITMQLWDPARDLPDDTAPATLDANSLEAKKVAELLGIPHHSVALGESFRACVTGPFLAEYVAGRTPNPCVFCNRKIKFGKLMEVSRSFGYPYLATGHYAKIEKSAGGYLLKKASDPAKDQSYFLWGIRRELLPFILFPLGNYTKQEIREIAAAHHFANAHRTDSQDICFIPDGDYAAFLRAHTDCGFAPGNFVSPDGSVLGRHEGIVRYTVGQRKGLGVAFGHPMFVAGKDPAANTVTLCEDRELYADRLTASDINLLACETLEAPTRLEAKIRYRHTATPATVEQIGEGRLQVIFDTPQRAIAPGQSLVLYDGDTVIGGGIID